MAFSKNRRLAQIISDINGNISVQGITVPTQSASDNDTSAASTAFVHAHVNALVDSAPGTLNTLNELAAALNDEANFGSTITTAVNAKLPLAGGTLTGALTTNGVINTGTSHNFAINTPNSLRINIDSNNSATDQVFVIGKNQTAVDASNDVLLKVGEDGNVFVRGCSNITTTAGNTNLQVLTTNSQGANLGGSIGMGGVYNATNQITFAEIHGKKTNSTAANLHGYMSFVTRGDNIAERMRIDSLGKVGIGTDSPTAILDVRRGDASGKIAEFHNNSGFGIDIGTDSDSVGYISSGYTQAFVFKTDAGSGQVERMRIDSAGDINLVKAGTAQANLNFTTDGSLDYARMTGGKSGSGVGDLRFFTYSGGIAERMRIDSLGNVGIGATSPSKALHLKRTSGWATMRLEGASDSGGELEFYKGSTKAGGIFFNNSDDLNIRCGNTERMRITSAGAVLIGQTSQTGYTFAQQLVVGGGTGNNNQGITIQSAQNSQGNLAFNRDNGTTAYGRISYQHGTNYMAFMTNNAERMRIDTNGKVGIGVTDASNAKLVINGGVGGASDHPMIDFDGYGSRVDGASQSINFRMGRTGQATDQGAQIRSVFQGGGATAGQTAIGFEFRPINGNVVGTTVRFSGTGQRIQFWSDELPHSNNPITNQAFVIGPSSSGAITSGLTNSTVLLNRGGELYAIDSSHNNTQITPHNWGLISSGPSEELAWTYYSQRPNPNNNEEIQTINVDMAKVIRKVEDLVGEKLIYTENSDKDSHTFKNVIADIQTALANLTTRIETLEG